MRPMGFVSLNDFHHRKLQPSQPISVFMYYLKELIKGRLGEVAVESMLDSGSSESLIQCDILKSIKI